LSSWFTIDTFGLNDRYLARTSRRDPEYLLSASPDIVVLISGTQGPFTPRLAWENDLYRLGVARGYRRLGSLRFSNNYYLWIMGAPNSSVAAEVQRRLGPALLAVAAAQLVEGRRRPASSPPPM
jgi:hypothetical protein